MSGSNTIYYEYNNISHHISGKPGWFSDQGVSVSPSVNSSSDETFISTYNREEYIYDDLSIFVTTGDTPKLNHKYYVNTSIFKSKSSYKLVYNWVDILAYADSSSFVQFNRYDENVISGNFYFYSPSDSSHQEVRLINGWFDIEVER